MYSRDVNYGTIADLTLKVTSINKLGCHSNPKFTKYIIVWFHCTNVQHDHKRKKMHVNMTLITIIT